MTTQTTEPSNQHSEHPEKKKNKSGFLPKARIEARVLTFLVCFGTWIILSGQFDFFHLTLGVIASCIIAAISADILFPVSRFRDLPGIAKGFISYLPWLIYQIFKANLHVLYLSLHPRMKDLIDPQVITFQSKLKGDMALLTFANSITLTPGTITLYVSVIGKYTVHAIDSKSALGLPGEMEEKVEAIFK